MTLLALLQKGITGDAAVMPAKSALRLATINGARALGIDKLTGSLETGKCADIAIYDTGSYAFCPGNDAAADIVYSADGKDVLYTIANGRILYEKGEILFADTKEVFAKVKAAASRLV